MKHFFHPDAAIEFEESVRYYREQGLGLGERFATEVKIAIKRITQTPERWRLVDDDVHRCPVRIFPYSVLYTKEKDYLLIIAIAHSRREPGYWKHRLPISLKKKK
jgi:hypothetical protein